MYSFEVIGFALQGFTLEFWSLRSQEGWKPCYEANPKRNLIYLLKVLFLEAWNLCIQGYGPLDASDLAFLGLPENQAQEG